MTEKEIKSKITQAHTDGYNRGYAKREEEIKTLGERCNQLLKDKGNLTDQIADIKANCDLAIEGKDVKIKELEQKNAELKKKLKEKLKTVADKDLSFVAKFDALEKENAELGEQLLVVSEQLRLAKEMPYSAVKKFAEEKTQEQLTKATELLQRFIKWARTENCEKFDVILADAEQFLQEIKE